jgi:L-asparagine oxygenase
MVNQYRLDEAERKAVRSLLVDLACDQDNLEETSFLNRAALFAQELPRSIRELFYEFKLRENACILLVTNNPIEAHDVGPTPTSHWRKGELRPLNLAQLMHGLYATLLGEPFGFETQQKGRLFNDLISIPGALDNSSSGSGRVGLHTEDVSETQPLMPDYLGFLCLRNEHGAVTTFSSLDNICIPDHIFKVLFQQCYPFRSGSPRAIFFGNPNRPYLRHSAVDDQKCSREMAIARQFVREALLRNQQGITLSQGDCVYFDNCLAVHGRAPFEAEYGANSRWFSRLFMLRDLRRIRSFTSSPESRIMLEDAVEKREMAGCLHVSPTNDLIPSSEHA